MNYIYTRPQSDYFIIRHKETGYIYKATLPIPPHFLFKSIRIGLGWVICNSERLRRNSTVSSFQRPRSRPRVCCKTHKYKHHRFFFFLFSRLCTHVKKGVDEILLCMGHFFFTTSVHPGTILYTYMKNLCRIKKPIMFLLLIIFSFFSSSLLQSESHSAATATAISQPNCVPNWRAQSQFLSFFFLPLLLLPYTKSLCIT